MLVLFLGCALLGTGYVKRIKTEQSLSVMAENKDAFVVLIDAGHGGKDPGKVGVNGALEKEINLAIARHLKTLLEHNEIAVIMTREEDKDLASETATNRKNEDLRERALLTKSVDMVISIHQNSYPEEDVDGAQVFYYAGSEEGKCLGTMLQERIKAELEDGNHRIAKANKEYYLLKKSAVPAVIVECGFLSNMREASLLSTKEYQRKLAFAIHLGVMEYINTTKDRMEDENGDKNTSD